MKTLLFNPDLSPAAAIFAKWVPIYTRQATMDDAEAEPFQAPLLDLETSIAALSPTSLFDFLLQEGALSMLGIFHLDADQVRHVQTLAVAESDERASLVALIQAHRQIFNRTQTFTEDTGRPAEDDAEYDALLTQEFEALNSVVSHSTASISNAALKGRYLAALQRKGGLGYEAAQAFVDSFASMGEPA